MYKKIFLIMALAFTVGMHAFARGESEGGNAYPRKNVKVIIPYSAGGGSDTITRKIVEIVKEDFNNKISVENRTGGAGSVGMLYGANSKPDGYTISMIAVEVTILPHTGTGGNLAPDLFKPVILFNTDFSVIAVKRDSKWKNLNDMIEASRVKSPSVGNSGVGSIWHYAGAALAHKAGVRFNTIPFEGAAPAITALLGGHLDAVSVSYGEVLPYVKSGDLKIFASLSPQRIEGTIPTAKEEGYDVSVGTWRGFAVPKDTPDAIVYALYQRFNKAVNSEEYKAFMKKSGFGVRVLGPKEFAEQLDKDYKQFGKLTKLIGLSKK